MLLVSFRGAGKQILTLDRIRLAIFRFYGGFCGFYTKLS